MTMKAYYTFAPMPKRAYPMFGEPFGAHPHGSYWDSADAESTQLWTDISAETSQGWTDAAAENIQQWE